MKKTTTKEPAEICGSFTSFERALVADGLEVSNSLLLPHDDSAVAMYHHLLVTCILKSCKASLIFQAKQDLNLCPGL